MALCLESYVGAVGGTCGVKLEDQLLVTARGAEPLSNFPFDERLLGN
jgi:Xaa-Pro aminopeptidase